MKKNRNFYFLLIGAAVFVFYYIFIEIGFNKLISVMAKNPGYNILESFENKNRDLFLAFKSSATNRTFHERYSVRDISKNVSKDIMIVGIDENL